MPRSAAQLLLPYVDSFVVAVPKTKIADYKKIARKHGKVWREHGALAYVECVDHHDVRAADVVTRRLRGNLAAAADSGPKDFSDLLLVPRVGARTVRALAMVAEVVHGAPYRFSDPARFSIAHGGKDRHSYPVPLKVYDRTIAVMKRALGRAKLGHAEELAALRCLDDQARNLERHASGSSLKQFSSRSGRGRTNTEVIACSETSHR
jgi:hypothetical protein